MHWDKATKILSLTVINFNVKKMMVMTIIYTIINCEVTCTLILRLVHTLSARGHCRGPTMNLQTEKQRLTTIDKVKDVQC